MKAFVLLACCLTVALAVSVAPEFVLDLDKAPGDRWKGAVELILNAHGWEYSVGPVISKYEPLFSLLPAGTSETILGVLQSRWPDQLAELQTICDAFAAAGHPELNLTTMSVWTYFYEFSHISLDMPKYNARSCTGILSLPEDRSKNIIHGRNMDESPAPGRNMTLAINVTRGGKVIYQVYDWTWMTTGFVTSSGKGVTLEENWRNVPQTITYEMIMQRITDGVSIPTNFLHRFIQDAELGFDDAVAYLANAKFAAPFYTIMSGSGRRGAVATIGYDNTTNVFEFINDTSPVWFMVQTNYDRWLPDPPSDPRRTVAQNTLTAIGRPRGGSELGVWMTLEQYPVKNLGTMYSTIMRVGEDIIGYIREQMTPYVPN